MPGRWRAPSIWRAATDSVGSTCRCCIIQLPASAGERLRTIDRWPARGPRQRLHHPKRRGGDDAVSGRSCGPAKGGPTTAFPGHSTDKPSRRLRRLSRAAGPMAPNARSRPASWRGGKRSIPQAVTAWSLAAAPWAAAPTGPRAPHGRRRCWRVAVEPRLPEVRSAQSGTGPPNRVVPSVPSVQGRLKRMRRPPSGSSSSRGVARGGRAMVRARPFHALAILGADDDPSMQAVAIAVGARWRKPVGPAAELLDAPGLPGAPHGAASGDRRCLDHRQGVVGIFFLLVVKPEASAREEGFGAVGDLLDQGRHLLIGRSRRTKPVDRAVVGVFAVEPVKGQNMEVQVQIQSGAEALRHRDAAALAPGLPRAPAQPPSDLAQRHPQHALGQLRTAGQQQASRPRNGDHPLADGHDGEELVDPARRSLGHPPPAAGRAKPPSLARKGHQPVVVAALALQPGRCCWSMASM